MEKQTGALNWSSTQGPEGKKRRGKKCCWEKKAAAQSWGTDAIRKRLGVKGSLVIGARLDWLLISNLGMVV